MRFLGYQIFGFHKRAEYSYNAIHFYLVMGLHHNPAKNKSWENTAAAQQPKESYFYLKILMGYFALPSLKKKTCNCHSLTKDVVMRIAVCMPMRFSDDSDRSRSLNSYHRVQIQASIQRFKLKFSSFLASSEFVGPREEGTSTLFVSLLDWKSPF